jgi:hypothetical protein
VSVVVLPDSERITSTFLRSRAEVTALVSDRVYTELPKRELDRTFPLVRLVRSGGGATGSPRFLDRAILTFDVWGGTKYEARLIAETVAAVLDDVAGYSAHDGYSTGASPGSLRYLPDDTFEPAKPRYQFDAVVFFRPTP